MNKKLKIMISALCMSLFILSGKLAVKAETVSPETMVEQALKEKTFYHYNVAYYEVMKLTDENRKNILLGKLASIGDAVWRQGIKDSYATLLDMVDTASGRIYDDIQVQISNADIPEVDKQYLLGEVTSWGRKLVWTDDYGKSVDMIIKAWTNMDEASIKDADTALSLMKNKYSKAYLNDELDKIKVIQTKVPAVYTNADGNINNLGFAVQSGEWVYYSNVATDGKLSMAKLDGTQATKINNDEVMFINIEDNWIYYINYSDNATIYKISLDGTKRTKLNNDPTATLHVIDGIIYYQKADSELKLYKMNTDGNGVVKLSDDKAGNINIVNEYIYYINMSNKNEVVRINGEGKGKKTITEDTPIFLNVIGDWVYYQSNADGHLYKIKTDGTGKTLVSSLNAVFANMDDKWIYFINLDDSNKLYRLSIDGKTNEKVADVQGGPVNILSDKVFFFNVNQTSGQLYSVNKDASGLSIFGDSGNQ